MKKILLTIAVISALSSVSCQKFDNEKDLTFDVSVESTTVKVGDPVTFKIKGGDANQISFYSGDIGNDYEYRNKNRIDQIKKVFFSFRTHNVAVGQEVEPDLFISNDFNGTYDYENVNSATWKPISGLFTWGPNGPWQTMWTPSGTAELTAYLDEGKPFYIAHRVKSEAMPTGSIGRNFRASSHSLIAETIAGNYLSLADYKGMAWTLVDKYLEDSEIKPQSTSVVSSSILLLGYYNSSSPRYRLDSEIWGVSRKFDSGEISLGSEGSVSLKQYVDPPIDSHTYYYENPGVYKVVFIASNATISSSKQVIKELKITVTK